MPRKPIPLRPGDLVSLVAPAGPWDRERLDRGVALLESWGLRVEPCELGPPRRYLAGDDRSRGRRLEAAFADERVRGVLAVRGGYGSARLQEHLDLSAMAADPKVFVGFSDITILLGRLLQEARVVAYHGPMVAADLPRLAADAQERFRRFLFNEPGWFGGGVREGWRPGVADGPLVGGCLSVIVTTLGTPYEISTDGCILFLEDVAEKPYRIDRMLYHMKHAGKFENVRGLVLGPMTDCDDGGGPNAVREIVADVLDGYEFPIAYGLDAGHGSGNVVLPLGCRVRLDASSGLELTEPAFS